jgi:chromosome segregation protein
MELTLGVPCQALLLFDADLPKDMFSLAMTALAIVPAPSENPTTNEPERLEEIQSLKMLKAALDRYQFLRGKYIILPNVSDGGSMTLLRAGAAGKYAEMPCVGGYVDGSVDKLGRGNLEIVAGRNSSYGNKRIALFQTSDSRREDRSDLGRHATWVKWAVPTAEALRQACLAQESRISHAEPALPASYIQSISIANSTFLGPVDIELSPQYTAFIGGRGTGKSTLLEYLRWALCDQPASDTDEDAPRHAQRREQLIQNTLRTVKATVEVRMRLNSVSHVVRRDAENGEVSLKVGDREFRPSTEAEIRSILPIQAYSQKQLSDVGVRSQELLRFVTAPVLEELTALDRRIELVATNLRALYARKRQRQDLERGRQQTGTALTSLRQQAAAVRESLKGLDPAARETLDKYQAYYAAEQAIGGWARTVTEISNAGADLKRRVETARASSRYVCEHDELQVVSQACGSYQAFLALAAAQLSALTEAARGLLEGGPGGTGQPWREWESLLAAYKRRHQEAMAEHSSQSERVKALGELEAQVARLAEEQAGADRALQELQAAEQAFDTSRREWRGLLTRRRELLDAQCRRLTDTSRGAIKAEVRRAANPARLVERLRSAAAGSGVQRAKIDTVGRALTDAPEPEVLVEELLSELERLAEFHPGHEGREGLPSTPALQRLGFTPSELRKLAGSLDREGWLAVALTPLEDVPVFSYRSKEDQYIPFDHASAGQQATALLKTLLNQPGPPLIIDQPEEDLDNPVVLEVVEQIWAAKSRRQIIFASHNANLVVNGDAELVVWCDHRTAADQSRGKVAGEGAIDVPAIREAVTRVMEGGEAAFNLRMQKYGF